jgi:hypothetical protein
MKIKISKSQWEKIGRIAGWMKKETSLEPQRPICEVCGSNDIQIKGEICQCNTCGAEFSRKNPSETESSDPAAEYFKRRF